MFSAPEPAVFYYYTGLEGVWTNSPDVGRANYLVGVSKKGVTLDAIKTPEQLPADPGVLSKIHPHTIIQCCLSPIMLLLLYYLVSGYGVLTLFRLRLKTAYMITLSMLLGVAVASLVPFLMQLLFIPLTPARVFGTLILAALALNIPSIRRIRKEGFTAFRRSFTVPPFRDHSL